MMKKSICILAAIGAACIAGITAQEMMLFDAVRADLPKNAATTEIVNKNGGDALNQNFIALAIGRDTIMNGSKSYRLPKIKQAEVGENRNIGDVTINISIGDNIFTATLEQNATADEFCARLPISINMSDLNKNEKYYFLDKKLPTAAEKFERVKRGDLMLYDTDCLVLFYENFESNFEYTKIGEVDDPEGLEKALGNGEVQVQFGKR